MYDDSCHTWKLKSEVAHVVILATVLIQLNGIYQLGFSSSAEPIGGHALLQYDWLIPLNSTDTNYLH